MAGDILTTSYATNITDPGHTGTGRTLQIFDKKTKIDISQEITEVDPNRAPFLRFLNALGNSSSCSNFKYEWLDEDFKKMKTTLGATGVITSSTATTLVVDDADVFVPGDVVRVVDSDAKTTELMLIISKVSSTTYTVRRGAAGSSVQATFTDNDEVIKVGSAFSEGGLSADPDSTEPDWFYNYVQNFKSSVRISGRMDAVEVVGTSNELQRQLRRRMINHMESIEGAFLWGRRSHSTVVGDVGRTFTGGMEYWLDTHASTTNVLDATSAAFTFSYLNSNSNSIFRYGSEKKLAITSGAVLTKINEMAFPYLRLNKEATKNLGVQVTDLTLTHGTLSLVHSRFMEHATLDSKVMFIIDPSFIRKRYMPGRDTHINTNVQSNDEDAVKHEILSDIGLEIRNVKAHFMIENIDTTIT